MNKEEWKAHLKSRMETGGPPFSVNRWGSCQYDTARWFYDLFLMIRSDLSLEDTLEVLGCKVTYDRIATVDDAKYVMLEMLEDYKEDDEAEGDMESAKQIEGYMEKVKNAVSVETLFEVSRNMCWDLWSSAPRIAGDIFVNLKIKAPLSPGQGPVFNIMAQEDNFKVGLCCALLREHNLVKDDTCFRNFDT